MYIALASLKKEIRLKWNTETVIDHFDDEIYVDNQYYPSDYVLELQAVKTMYDYYHHSNDDLISKTVCDKCFFIADELNAQISYYRTIYHILRRFVNERFLQLGHLLHEQNNNNEVPTNHMLQGSLETLQRAAIWYERSSPEILAILNDKGNAFSKSAFGLTLKTFERYTNTLIQCKHELNNLNIPQNVKYLWQSLNNCSENFNIRIKEIERIQNAFSNSQSFSHSITDIEEHYNDLIYQLKNFPNNEIAKSCCKEGRGSCVAIMDADDRKWYTLSGLDNTNVLPASNDDIYALAQKLSMPGYSYARLNRNVMRYTKYNDTNLAHHPFLNTPIKLALDYDAQNQKDDYSCCERKLLASDPNGNHYEFFIKYKPCKRCLPAMAQDNIISHVYAREKGFYNQNNTIKTIRISDLGDSYKISEDFDIEKDY